MAKQSLKNIIVKQKEVVLVVNSLIEQLKASVFIEDENGKLLLGDTAIPAANVQVIMVDDEPIGYVKGDENVAIIAKLLTLLSNKETEKKKLGSEILNLYQEVNLMFNFSEKLAQSIGAPDISKITLIEASRVIKSDNGVIILWDESTKRLNVMAATGELFFHEEKINSELPLLIKIIFNGTAEIITDILLLKKAGIILPEVQSIIYASLKVNQRVMGAVILAGQSCDQYSAGNLKLLTTLSLQASAAIESALLYEKSIQEAREREDAMRLIYKATNKFVPHQFIKSLGHNLITDVNLGDQVEKIVTVLFSDIREYTSISEQMTPTENFKFVCSFNERMGPIIQQHNGFINQYLGDAIMAIFSGNAQDALSAAIAMQKDVQQFNKERSAANELPIKIGVGMHTGSLIMGITGDKDRLDATTISDTVNIASRLESLTKYYKGKIIISDATLDQIENKENFNFRHLGKVKLKGKITSTSIYECIGGDIPEDLQKKTSTLSFFEDGMSNYLNQSFEKAVNAFEQVVAFDPNDLTAKFFLENAIGFTKTGVPSNWIGVEEMQSK
jgi:class 3 adenylate cyclase